MLPKRFGTLYTFGTASHIFRFAVESWQKDNILDF